MMWTVLISIAVVATALLLVSRRRVGMRSDLAGFERSQSALADAVHRSRRVND
jgi:hypothetical protein